MGFHPIDGARFLHFQGFPADVCNLVAHHSASADEAVQRGIDLSVFAEFSVDVDLGKAHAVVWWRLDYGPPGSGYARHGSSQ